MNTPTSVCMCVSVYINPFFIKLLWQLLFKRKKKKKKQRKFKHFYAHSASFMHCPILQCSIQCQQYYQFSSINYTVNLCSSRTAKPQNFALSQKNPTHKSREFYGLLYQKLVLVQLSLSLDLDQCFATYFLDQASRNYTRA